MEIASRSLLRPVAERPNRYNGKDKEYIITAIPVTTRRFGPSGSLKNKNSALEHTIEVMPKISREVFFDLKCMFVSILEEQVQGRLQRWGQPAQQHGLRIPPLSFESAFSIRMALVSAFLPDVTQQIHSLRASGVMSSHTARAAGAPISSFRKSFGSVCIAPPASFSWIIRSFYQT